MEVCFWKTIEIAHHQQAKSWKRRAVMSLARLWQRRGTAEARDLLAQVYDCFTEGFDPEDCQEGDILAEVLG